jgi:UDP-glucose 4-epimerase
MKSAIVTGATSMIGSAIVKALLEKGVNEIYAVVRRGSTKISRLPNDRHIKIIECNIDQYAQLSKLVTNQCDVFYHIAWQANGSAQVRNSQIFQQADNLRFSLDALMAAHELGCKKFIGAGSQAEFGLLDLNKISPNSPTNPIQPYGIIKYATGKLITEQAKLFHMNSFWVRIFSVYGLYDRANSMVTSTIIKLLKGETPLFTPAEQRWDYLYSLDAGMAFYYIGEYSDGNKVYCLGSGEARYLREYIEEIHEIVNSKIPIKIGALPYPKGAIMNLCADTSELSHDTGWKPQISFGDGIKDMLVKVGSLSER